MSSFTIAYSSRHWCRRKSYNIKVFKIEETGQFFGVAVFPGAAPYMTAPMPTVEEVKDDCIAMAQSLISPEAD